LSSKYLPSKNFAIEADYIEVNDASQMLGRGSNLGDPLQFFMVERQLIRYYRNRIPKLTPSLIMTKGGLDEYGLRKNTFRQILGMVEYQHIRLVDTIFKAQLETADYQARYMAAELVWTDYVRAQDYSHKYTIDFERAMSRIQEQAQKRRDEQLHEYAKIILELEQEHERKLKKMGMTTTKKKLSDMELVNSRVRTILQEIETSGDSDRVKDQRAVAILDLSKRIFD
jgi:hypothetical protein